MRINREELAWAAGFYDGEGTCYARSTRRRPQVQLLLSLSQVNVERLVRFRDALGGKGRIYGPIKLKRPSPPQWQPVHHWYVSSFEDVQASVALLWTWLSRESQQVSRAFRRFLAYHHAQAPQWKRRAFVRKQNQITTRAQLKLVV